MEIKRCEFSEETNGGKSVTILWNATNVDFVKIDGRRVSSKHFESSPKEDHIFQIGFFAKDGHYETINLPIWYDYYSNTYYITEEECKYVSNSKWEKDEIEKADKNATAGSVLMVLSGIAFVIGFIIVCVKDYDSESASDKAISWLVGATFLVGYVGYKLHEHGKDRMNHLKNERTKNN